MCTQELTAYINPDGGRPIFGFEGVRQGLPVLKLPCGKCPECCKNYYTQWATRGSRELARWDSSLFVTLTYDSEHLPPDNSLRKKDLQDFIKRLKKRLGSSKTNPIRQIYCGEYGTKTRRPHYHCIFFNCDLPDKKLFRHTDQNHAVYTSEILTSLWNQGNVEFGYAEPASIAYLFKYILKKKSRKQKKQPLIIERDGITYEVAHEFIEASRNPGIGAHMRESKSIKKGFLYVDGVKKKLPKYYTEWLRTNDPETFDNIQNLKFDFMSKLPIESELRKKQKQLAQKKLTDTKKKL